MARKKTEKVIHLFTESFDGNLLETLASLEPGPLYIQSGETPDGLGVYLCDEPFTLEEAEAMHSVTEEGDPFGDGDDDDLVPLDEVEVEVDE